MPTAGLRVAERGSPDDQRPVLGIVVLDLPQKTAEFGRFVPRDRRGLGSLPPGFFESPATWPFPTAYAVAKEAGAQATLRGEEQAVAGVCAAVERLDPVADLIIGDCGFFWAAREAASARAQTPLLLSGLDLLPLAASVTARPVGVLTYSADHLEPMLAGHQLGDRLRILGFSHEPTWHKLSKEGYGSDPTWSATELRDEFAARVEQALSPEGLLDGIGALVVECTVIPQFRPVLRELTNVPIFDVAAEAVGLLARQPAVNTT